jgi:hypothetical protein
MKDTLETASRYVMAATMNEIVGMPNGIFKIVKESLPAKEFFKSVFLLEIVKQSFEESDLPFSDRFTEAFTLFALASITFSRKPIEDLLLKVHWTKPTEHDVDPSLVAVEYRAVSADVSADLLLSNLIVPDSSFKDSGKKKVLSASEVAENFALCVHMNHIASLVAIYENDEEKRKREIASAMTHGSLSATAAGITGFVKRGDMVHYSKIVRK